MLLMYWTMTICCCLYAAIAGGRTGRAGAFLIACKTIAGFKAALMDQSWGATIYPVLLVDLIFLIAILVLALRSDRLWPLWTTACALCAVVVHLASIADLEISPSVYQALKDIWSLAMQLFMVRGIVLDVRSRRTPSLTRENPA